MANQEKTFDDLPNKKERKRRENERLHQLQPHHLVPWSSYMSKLVEIEDPLKMDSLLDEADWICIFAIYGAPRRIRYGSGERRRCGRREIEGDILTCRGMKIRKISPSSCL